MLAMQSQELMELLRKVELDRDAANARVEKLVGAPCSSRLRKLAVVTRAFPNTEYRVADHQDTLQHDRAEDDAGVHAVAHRCCEPPPASRFSLLEVSAGAVRVCSLAVAGGGRAENSA